MRRIIPVLVMLLLSAQALATVTISAIQEVPATAGGAYSAARQCNVIDINYVCSAGERVRAIAVEVNIDNGFYFSGISDYNSGESSALAGKKTGYGIFPGKFRDVINPTSPNWGDPCYFPVAPAIDLDADGTGIGTHKVILELGTLYAGDTNKPAASGTLCRLWVIPPRPVMDCNLQIAVNTNRRGVVLENGTTITPTLVARGLVSAGKVSFPDCFPCWQPCDVQYAQFIAVWKPNCWCGQYAATDSNGSRAYQCYGDTDAKTETLAKYRVYSSDYVKLITFWKYTATQLRNTLNGFCTDFDHKSETLANYRVYSSDYNILIENWKATDAQLNLKGLCPKCP